MQSSGASLLAFTLAQKQESLAFIDVWNMFAAPELETDRDCVAKVVVTTAYSLETHRRRFRPDVTLLVLRHPGDTYESLFAKGYANDSGLIDEKFSLLEDVFKAGTGFDGTVYYEDFVFSPRKVISQINRIGWALDCGALLFRRSSREIDDTNSAAISDLAARLKYGSGNVNANGMLRNRVRFSQPWGKTGHLPQVCPSLFVHYEAMRAERAELWHVPSRALLSCKLGAIIRGRTASGSIEKQSERAGYTLRIENAPPQCRVSDTELFLHPTADRSETRFTVSGLPGPPFNRVRGSAFTIHPLASGTMVKIGIEDEHGACLAEQEFALCHSDMRNIDLSFEPGGAALTLSVSVRLAKGVRSVESAGICFRDLSLDQVAD
jgi:hypothetical protein